MIPEECRVYSLTLIPLFLQAHKRSYTTIPTSECLRHLRVTVSLNFSLGHILPLVFKDFLLTSEKAMCIY